MEAYPPLPVDLFAGSSAVLDDDPSTYFSLSQFDLELQQQAQAALLQQDSWQDFDKYLPLDNQLFNNGTLRNDQQAQPIFMNNNNNYNTEPSLLYEPLSDLLPFQQQAKPLFDVNSTAPNWDNNNDTVNIKQEYASPESMPYSPPENIQSHLPSSPQQTANQMPLFQQQSNLASPPSETKTSPKASNLATPALDFMNWNSPPSGTTLDTVSQQGKVPIQRLKSNSIINNAVNAALNNTNPPAGRQHKKTAHNAIERRYRNNINDRIAELKNAVPALLYAKVKDNRAGGKRGHEDEDDAEDGEEFLDGVAVATKLNKATILRKATEYINHLKKTGDDTRRENQALQHILTQLPGGQDILQRYHLQKQQREQEMHQQQLLERERQKQQEQKHKAANRKRARLNNHSHSDEYESSSSSPDPVTPPAMTNRVFMALFMAITFFSTSPLTAGPSSSAQYQSHHHSSRTTSSNDIGATDTITQNLGNANAAPETFLGSLFNFNDTWSSLRTVVFIICIVQLFFPYIKSMLFGSSLKLKRVSRSKRAVASSPRKEISNSALTPGDLKCRQIYSILEKSISNQEDQDFPRSAISTFFPLLKETARIFSHHILGYDIMYDNHGNTTPEEEWSQVCKWIKLNETSCVGGANNASRLSMLYSCFRMINLVDTLDEDRHEHVMQTHARAYATAAMQMSLIIPRRALADKLSEYFWQHAISHHDDEDEQVEESSLWMQSLAWMDTKQDHDSIQDMRYSRAWSEAIEILQNQTSDVVLHPMSISYTAPVVVPVAILSTLHLLDNLRIQFDHLIHIMSREEDNQDQSYAESLETAFLDIMLLTEPLQEQTEESASNDQQRLAHWLAAVGATVEALWKDNIEQAEKWLPALIQRVPRSMTCKAGTVSQKSTWNQLDEAMKKTMIHLLVGALLLRNSDVEKQKQGLVELENAEVLYENVIRKLQGKLHINNNENESDLEFSVMTQAAFVVAFTGLEAWIMAMKLDVSPEKELRVNNGALRISVSLRNMTRILQGEDKSSMVKRLSHLGQYINQHDIDSACSLPDNEAEDAVSTDQEALSNHQILVKKADRAQLILRGLE